MIAARQFARQRSSTGLPGATAKGVIELYGSLSATGRGRGTDRAILLGLQGHVPDLVDPQRIEPAITAIPAIRTAQRLELLGQHGIDFHEKTQLRFMRPSLAYHPNGMRFVAWDQAGQVLAEQAYFSVGGGFVVNAQGQRVLSESAVTLPDNPKLPHPFHTGAELLALCHARQRSIAQLMLDNQTQWRPAPQVGQQLDRVWAAMQGSIQPGLAQRQRLDGQAKRRPPAPSCLATAPA